MKDYGKLIHFLKTNTKAIFTFENGVIIVELDRSYDDAWLVITEMHKDD